MNTLPCHANSIEHLMTHSGENFRNYTYLKIARFGSKQINRTGDKIILSIMSAYLCHKLVQNTP